MYVGTKKYMLCLPLVYLIECTFLEKVKHLWLVQIQLWLS